jgi:iron complex outermembrane recepter protein
MNGPGVCSARAGFAASRCRRPRGPAVAACVLASIAPGFAGAEPDFAALADLSLEELANISITSVSRRPEPLADAPASIFVITAEDIRRSGYRSLPAVLRLAPNLQVAQSSASGYAVSARGFSNDNGLANKLLVLIDGRTVYSPSLSGVLWDMQDVMLEDIERIEVISGPGPTLWGTNAVNGVINVITRAAGETRGALVSVGGGDLRRGAAFRFGGGTDDAAFRVYGKVDELDNTTDETGTALTDGFDRGQIGFRVDWGGDDRSFTLQGDSYRGESDDRPFVGSVEVSGTNVLARWTRRLAGGSDVRLQVYFDHALREDRLLFWDETDVVDVDFQHGLSAGAHELLWGVGYRHARDDARTSLFFAFVPPERDLDWLSVFVQDEIALGENVALTLGLRPERNDYTDWELLPSARVAWTPSDGQLVWGAVSRAVRAPARLDRDLFFPPDGAFIRGGPDFVSEVADVIELGYRAQPAALLSYSVTAFHQVYDKLRSGQLPPAVVQNRIDGTVSGVEGWAVLQPADAWRVSGGFTVLNKDLAAEADSGDPVGPSALGNDPEQQWMLRAAYTPAARHELDVIVRRVSSLPQPHVPSYTAVDAHWTWLPRRDVQVSLSLQNLFDSAHAEFGTAPVRSEIERGAYLNVAWRN